MLSVDKVKKNIDELRRGKTILSVEDVVKDIEKVDKSHIGKTTKELVEEFLEEKRGNKYVNG